MCVQASWCVGGSGDVDHFSVVQEVKIGLNDGGSLSADQFERWRKGEQVN